jgi:hypothetical protein
VLLRRRRHLAAGLLAAWAVGLAVVIVAARG